MSISEISSNDAQNQDTSEIYLLKTASHSLQGCIRVANKAKNVFLGSALAVVGTAFCGAEVLIKSVLPPASGALALYISSDAISFMSNSILSNNRDSNKEAKMVATIMFAAWGAIALTATTGNLSSCVRDIASLCNSKSKAYFNA